MSGYRVSIWPVVLLLSLCVVGSCDDVSSGDTDADADSDQRIHPDTDSFSPVCGDGYCDIEGGENNSSCPADCPTSCNPDCTDRECGSDPVCGESCGACISPQVCNVNGQCEPYTPTEEHHICNTGRGSPPDGNSEETCYPWTWLQDPDNWDTVAAADNRVGPDDIVYIHNATGPITNSALHFPSGGNAADGPIVFDGYEDGVCDAHNSATACSESAVMSGTFFGIGEYSHVTIRDFVFNNQTDIVGSSARNPATSFVTSCRGWDIEGECKTSHIKVLSNRFLGERRGSAISFGFVSDWLVRDNYYRGDGLCCVDNCDEPLRWDSTERFIGLRPGGARGRFINNHIIDSYHAFYSVISVDRNSPDPNTDDELDFPPAGSYSHDPEANPTGLEIAYNLWDGWCQEGISFDDPGGGTSDRQFPAMETDTISHIDGNEIILDNSDDEWSQAKVSTDRYSGFYLVNTTGEPEKYGKLALIESQYQNRFTVASSDVSKFSIGDRISVAQIQNKIWIHHNRMVREEGHAWGWGPIWIEGNWFNGLIENNRIEPKSGGANYIMLQSVHHTTYNSHGVTKTPGHNATAFNLVRYNRAEKLQATSYPHHGEAGWQFSYNNAWINNILWDNDEDRCIDNLLCDSSYCTDCVHCNYCNELFLQKTESYYDGSNVYSNSGAEIDIYIHHVHGGGQQSSNPTTGVPDGIYSQSHIGPNILFTHIDNTTQTLTITFTEAITGCTDSSCGFCVVGDDSTVEVNNCSGSGPTRTCSLGSTLAGSTQAYLYYDGTGNISDTAGNQMYPWSVVGHDLLTEYIGQ